MKWYEVLTCRIDPADGWHCAGALSWARWRLSCVGLGQRWALVASRILHNASPTVQQWLKKARPRIASVAAGGNRRTFTWLQLHTQARVASVAFAGNESDYGGRPSQSVLGVFVAELGASAIVGLMPLCHARQCDSGGRVGAEHGANGRMFGSFSASAQVGVAVRYIRHRVREVRGEPPCSPGLRVRVIERSFVTVLLFG